MSSSYSEDPNIPTGPVYWSHDSYWGVAPRDNSGSPSVYDSDKQTFFSEDGTDTEPNELLAALLQTPAVSEQPVAMALPDTISVVGFREPHAMSDKREFITLHKDANGSYFLNNAEIAEHHDHDSGFREVRCADGNVWYILPDDFRGFFPVR
jgi:hypothetical protein